MATIGTFKKTASGEYTLKIVTRKVKKGLGKHCLFQPARAGRQYPNVGSD